MPKRCYMIVNPTSGGYSRQKIEAVISSFKGHGLRPELMLTGSAADAPLFARRACEEETGPLIVVGGGDGTINGVVNGVIPGRATLGALPFGTANVLARELKIRSVEESVERIIRGKTRSLSVGMLEAHGETRYFFLMAGIGLDGAVVEGVRLAEKRMLGKGAYLLAGLRMLVRWDRQRFTLRADGRDTVCHSAVVCNGAKYGGDFVLAPEADLFAPGFQVVCVSNAKRLDYLKLAMDVVTGRKPQGRNVATFAANRLEISGGKAVQLDGDYFCHAPATITTVENFLRLIV